MRWRGQRPRVVHIDEMDRTNHVTLYVNGRAITGIPGSLDGVKVVNMPEPLPHCRSILRPVYDDDAQFDSTALRRLRTKPRPIGRWWAVLVASVMFFAWAVWQGGRRG